jgi:adenosylcobinamide-GDP ribazoletransferase
MFLSVLPVKIKKFDETKLANSIAYFPLVGLLFGLILVCLNYALSGLINVSAVNFILILALVLMDRGLHLDGLADTFDGLFGAKNKEDALRIMKDSNVGAFGVTAIVLVLFGQYVFLSSIDSQYKIAALIFMPSLARYGVVYANYFYKPAKTDGLAASFNNKKIGIFLTGTCIITLITAVIVFLQFNTIIPVLAGFAFILILPSLLIKKIGGVTGDIYGAIVEISQMSVLLLFCLIK